MKLRIFPPFYIIFMPFLKMSLMFLKSELDDCVICVIWYLNTVLIKTYLFPFYFDPMLRLYLDNCCIVVFFTVFLLPSQYNIIDIYTFNMKFFFTVLLKMRIDIFWLTRCLSIILHILHNHPTQFSRTSRTVLGKA